MLYTVTATKPVPKKHARVDDAKQEWLSSLRYYKEACQVSHDLHSALGFKLPIKKLFVSEYYRHMNYYTLVIYQF